MNLQGVHDVLHCSKASHTEVVNDFELVTEDFEQDARDCLDASPEGENVPMPHECDIKNICVDYLDSCS